MSTEVKDVVDRLRADAAQAHRETHTFERVSGHLGAKLAANCDEAAALIESLSSQVNKYAYERDKAREERDTAERRSEAFWKPQFINAESRATAAEGRVALLEEALGNIIGLLDSSIETHRFNAQHMIAEDTLVDAWSMLNMAREQFDTDANQLITIRELARARLAKGGQAE